MSGCHFRAAWWETDFLLIELKDAIKDSNIRFLGWDVSGAEPYQPVGIHYPKGETMKISFDDHLVYSNYAAFSMSSCSNIIYPKYSHWDVWFDNGSTEGGSSGSPLFEIYSPNGDEYRVLGQLTGDSSKCPPNTRSLYG